MGREFMPAIQRSRTSIDTSILRSKTGYAILKGGKFYDQALTRRVSQLTNDAKVEIRILNHKQRLFVEKRSRIMKRSENLVKAYNLPPLKGSTNTGSISKQNNVSSNAKIIPEIKGKCASDKCVNKQRDSRFSKAKGLADLEISGKHFNDQDNYLGPDEDDEDIRMSACSPGPSRLDYDGGMDRNVSAQMQELHLNSTAYPFITVENCEEVLPPVQKRAVSPSPPEYALKRSESRTGSSNSLEVPSPITQRRSLDGRVVTVISPVVCNFSRSEGSIPDALKSHSSVDDPRFRALEAVLKPATTCKIQTRAPAKIDIEFDTRPVSRSPSPRRQGRLLRREDERQYWNAVHSSKTPP